MKKRKFEPVKHEIRRFKPTSNGIRHQARLEKKLLSKNSRIIRSIISTKKKHNGRSSLNGRITVWHKGGGVKSLYRKIDYSKQNSNSIVIANCHDPYRTAFTNIGFELNTKKFFFNIAINTIFSGSLIKNSETLNEFRLGYRTKITNIPTGSAINNICINNSKKIQYIKSAGTYGQIVQTGLKKVKIRLPSKKIIEVPTNSYATIGVISNAKHNLIKIGKAGINRYMGIRPTVRGIAMNPVDHPHGGRTNGGRPSVTPWGLPTKGGFYLRKKK